MSRQAYGVIRRHPYRYNEALKGRIAPTPLTVPAFGVHAIPYFWLNRKTINTVVNDFDVDYDDERERFVDSVLGYEPDWISHGDNQKALIERFFQEVSVNESLVFFYVKHSPLDHLRAGGYLLVGAARVTGKELPGRWRTMNAHRSRIICGRQPLGTRCGPMALGGYSCRSRSSRTVTS